MAYLDDLNIVAKLTPAASTFRQLCVDDDGARSIGLEPRLHKCGIYGGDKEVVAAEAAKLRIAHQLDGFTMVGTPLGLAEYVPKALGGVERRLGRWWRRWCSSHSLYSSRSCFCVSHCKHAGRTSCARCLARRWRRTCVARTLQCGAGRQLCSTCLQGWVSTVPT